MSRRDKERKSEIERRMNIKIRRKRKTRESVCGFIREKECVHVRERDGENRE